MTTCFHRAACSAAVLGMFAFSGVLRADEHGTKATKADQQFALEAAKGGMAEVELGRLALQKASSDEVKQFAQRLVDDHSKANEELKAAAQQSGITLPDDMGPKHKAEMDRLSNLSGEAFDRAYVQHMMKDHKKDVAAFQKQANRGSDPNLKQFAQNTLPTLQDHFKTVQQLAGKKASQSADRMKDPEAGTDDTKRK